MLNCGQAAVDLQILLQKRHAAFSRALDECVCVCANPSWTLSVCKDPQDLGGYGVQWHGHLCQMCLAEWRPLSSRQVQMQCIQAMSRGQAQRASS